jgi:hypothetical protein
LVAEEAEEEALEAETEILVEEEVAVLEIDKESHLLM